MTPEMVGKMLNNNEKNIVCRDLPHDDMFYKPGLDQKVCIQNVYGQNGDNVEHNLYFINNRLTYFLSVFTPVDKNVDYHKYFDEKVDSLRQVIMQANISCSKWVNNTRRCSFHSSIAALDFTEGANATIISARPPYLLAEEYQRKATNGPVNVALYGLEVGKSNLNDLKKAAIKNNWKITRKDDFLNFDKPNQATYIVKPQEATDVHTLLADFDGDTLSEFTYWFIDPFKPGGKPVKANNDYLKLLNDKYGLPYSKPIDTFRTTEWRVNRGYSNEVYIRTDQSSIQELTFISYTNARLNGCRTIKDINKSVDNLMKRFYGSEIEL